MSFSMVLGRILLPAAGLLIATALAYQAIRTGRLELPGLPASGEPASTASRPADRDEGPRSIRAEGRVVAYPGASVTIGAETAGTIARVLVGEKSVVKRGDALLLFKTEEVKAQADEAAARLAEAEAELKRVEDEDHRLAAVLTKSPATQPDYERNHLYLLEYRARRDAARAGRARVEAVWRKHQAVAPIDGVVTARMVQPGETVEAGAPLLTIVDLSRLRVEAEVDEYDIGRLAVGQPAELTTEAFAGRSWPGLVEEVADALVGRRVRPEDPGRPADTRVLPVRVKLAGATPLRLGQRVEVAIKAGGVTPPESRRSEPLGPSPARPQPAGEPSRR